MRYQPKQTRQAFGRRHCVVANITIGVRTDETAQIAWPHVRLDSQIARHRQVDAEILLKAICVFDGFVVTAHKFEVGLGQEVELKVELEFGLEFVVSVVTQPQDKAEVQRMPNKQDDR